MIKALSVRQPWAWFIVQGLKDIENRDWRTSFRGPVLIHASKWWRQDEVYDDLVTCAEIAKGAGVSLGIELTLRMLKEQTGGIVGQATITDCVKAHNSPWFFGEYGFVLTEQKALPFRPCKGALGFFNPAPVAEAA